MTSPTTDSLVRFALDRDWRMLAGGALVPALAGGRMDAVNPATTRTIATIPAAGPEDVDVACEEIFGPVLLAMPFDGYEEVIERANALPLGLTASVWTSDLRTAMSAVRDLETGYAWVNWSSTHLPGTPFGGVKDSGVGREEGLEELYGYTQSKNVYLRFEG